jgi:hypothetical protein
MFEALAVYKAFRSESADLPVLFQLYTQTNDNVMHRLRRMADPFVHC